MDRYRKITWNKERETIKEINDKYNAKRKPEPPPKKTNDYTETYTHQPKNNLVNQSLFLTVFLAILAAATTLGGINAYLNYLETKEINKQLALTTKQFEKDLEALRKTTAPTIQIPQPQVKHNQPKPNAKTYRNPQTPRQSNTIIDTPPEKYPRYWSHIKTRDTDCWYHKTRLQKICR